MRAAVARQAGATQVLEQFTDPQPGPGVSVGNLLAPALNPLDVAFVNDQFPLRRLQPPCIAGYEAVAQLADGTRQQLVAVVDRNELAVRSSVAELETRLNL